MRPGNPIYAFTNVPFVLALAMGSLYLLAMLVIIGKAWLKHTDRLRFRAQPATLSDADAIYYGITSVLYIVTASVIHHHVSATVITWVWIALLLHVIPTFWLWGMFRFPSFIDMIVMTITSVNLALYLGTRLFTTFVPYLNHGQSITMYGLEATATVCLLWALIGPKLRAQIATVLWYGELNRYEEHVDRRRSRGT